MPNAQADRNQTTLGPAYLLDSGSDLGVRAARQRRHTGASLSSVAGQIGAEFLIGVVYAVIGLLLLRAAVLRPALPGAAPAPGSVSPMAA